MKVAISIGHGFENIVIGTNDYSELAFDPGAKNMETGVTEFKAAGAIGDTLLSMLEHSPIEVIEIPRCSLEERIQIINAEHKRWFIDLAIEIHLNAFEDLTINGSEVWSYPGSSLGGVAAQHLLDAFRETLHFQNRGVRSNLRLKFLRDTKPVAVLTEAAFISCDSVGTDLVDGSLIPKIAWAHALGIWSFAEAIS